MSSQALVVDQVADGISKAGSRCGLRLDLGGECGLCGQGARWMGSGGGRTFWYWLMTSWRGVGTGSPGHRKAAEYVAREFERAGLRPAGTEGYLQPVRLIARELDKSHSSLASSGDSGGDEPLVLGRDVIISSRSSRRRRSRPSWSSPGQACREFRSPSRRFAGLDVRGKLVVFLAGLPSIPGPLAAHMQSEGERGRSAQAVGRDRRRQDHESPEYGYPLGARDPGAVHAIDEPGRPRAGRVAGSQAGRHNQPGPCRQAARRYRSHFRRDRRVPNAGKSLPHFAIPARLKATAAVKRTEVVSQNVVALLEGLGPSS